jgi:hypothetical protein
MNGLKEKSDILQLDVVGQLTEEQGGMIAPVNSQELFEHVLNGSSKRYVGSGYW